MPQNTIEGIEKKLVKINRKLRKQFTLEQFENKVKQEVKADENKNVTVDQLKDFVLSMIENDMIHQRITKKDVEGFLSAFNYNTYGSTNIDSIAKMVFTRDD